MGNMPYYGIHRNTFNDIRSHNGVRGKSFNQYYFDLKQKRKTSPFQLKNKMALHKRYFQQVVPDKVSVSDSFRGIWNNV